MQEVLNLVEQMFYNADALKLELQASLLNDIINIIIQEGIPKEKEQIKIAFEVGDIQNHIQDAEEYYNQIYNLKKSMTPIQELKEIFQTGALSPLEFTMWFSANMWRLLDEEKKQMVDFAIGAYQDISKMKGVPENLISENKILFEEYYNQTYNQNK